MTNQLEPTEIKTILIVEDEQLLLELLCLYFSERGYNAVPANDGKIAWERYKETKPDLAVIDLALPTMSGFELIKLIRAENLDIPIVVASGYVESVDMVISVGADRFLQKPFLAEELFNKVMELLNARKEHLNSNRWEEQGHVLRGRIQRLEAELQNRVWKKRTDLEKMLDKIRLMCGAVSHSLKGEFMHIATSIEELKRMEVISSSDAKEEVNTIERSIAYSQVILRRLLDFVEVGEPKTEHVEINALMKTIEQLINPRMPSHVTFQSSIEPNVIGEKFAGTLNK